MKKNSPPTLTLVEDQVIAETPTMLMDELEHRVELIQPLEELPGLKPIRNSRPRRIQVPAAELYVDHIYQRGRSERSNRQIIGMIEEWDWALFQEPLVYKNLKNQIHVIDGQHTSVSWLSHPQLPALIDVDMIDSITTVKEAARVFGLRNTRRTQPHKLQLYKAGLAGEEPWAVLLYDISKKTGTYIPFRPEFNSAANTILAVDTVLKMADAWGEEGIVKILNVLQAGNLRPIRDVHMKAIARLLFEPEYSHISATKLKGILRKLNDNEVMGQITVSAVSMKIRRWEALAIRYSREYQAEFGQI